MAAPPTPDVTRRPPACLPAAACPPAPPVQVLVRLTDRRIAVEKELSALGEAKKDLKAAGHTGLFAVLP